MGQQMVRWLLLQAELSPLYFQFLVCDLLYRDDYFLLQVAAKLEHRLVFRTGAVVPFAIVLLELKGNVKLEEVFATSV